MESPEGGKNAKIVEKKSECSANSKNEEEMLPQSSSYGDDRLLSDLDSDSDTELVCKVCSKKFSGIKPFQQHEKSGKHAKAILKKRKAKELLQKIAAAEKISDNEDEYLFFVKKPFAVCQTCNKEFGGPESYQMHLNSKAHKQKVLQASILDQVKDNGEINTDMLQELYKNKQGGNPEHLAKDAKEKIDLLKLKDSEDPDESKALECKDCQKVFTGLIPYTQHILSKVHAKAVEKKTLLEKLTPKNVQHAATSKERDVSSLAMEDGFLVCKLCTTTFSGPGNAVLHLKSRGHSKNLEKFSWREQRKIAKRNVESAVLVDDTAATEGPKEVVDESEPASSTTSDSDSSADDDSTSSDDTQSDPGDSGVTADPSDTPPIAKDKSSESKTADEVEESNSNWQKMDKLYKTYKDSLKQSEGEP